MTEQKYHTRGEALVGRKLKGDGQHFTPGQMSARYITDEEAIFAFLTFVNKMGHAVCMLVCRKPGREWEPATEGYREAGHTVLYPERKFPEGFKLPEKTVGFLNEAERSWQLPGN